MFVNRKAEMLLITFFCTCSESVLGESLEWSFFLLFFFLLFGTLTLLESVGRQNKQL